MAAALGSVNALSDDEHDPPPPVLSDTDDGNNGHLASDSKAHKKPKHELMWLQSIVNRSCYCYSARKRRLDKTCGVSCAAAFRHGAVFNQLAEHRASFRELGKADQDRMDLLLVITIVDTVTSMEFSCVVMLKL